MLELRLGESLTLRASRDLQAICSALLHVESHLPECSRDRRELFCVQLTTMIRIEQVETLFDLGIYFLLGPVPRTCQHALAAGDICL